ncbi:hypothetical protein K402DRAFT_391758 [Aulographum hederae CBS 113979]|uniref:DUF7732 domain-containing protein n=1 Tax=Aulographum hederae CBS 113979 TaxID=1176131 RepID=A0A6G1H6B1_9PEZI|nr:hypothetical protein K402DRAFT_391758 [Aulographum hederae CBS 113979]
MKFSATLILSLLGASVSNGLLIPTEANSLSLRHAEGDSILIERDPSLERRKGGGGKGGGGSSSGGTSSGGSAGGSRGGSSSGSTGGRTSGSSSTGGRTSAGSGVRPSYGGGRYYGGGAAVPYAAGSRSPRGIVPILILGGAALFVLPGVWLYGAHNYPYSRPYTFYNQSAVNSSNPNGVNESLPVNCLCGRYQECGCDENDDPSYLNSLIGNGSYAALNKSLVNVADVDGRRQIYINGTLPNGTTAAGGSDDDDSSTTGGTSAAFSIRHGGAEILGYWSMAAIVAYSVWLL